MSQNLKKKLNSLTIIEDWFDNGQLSEIFNLSLGQTNVFSTIYVAIRNNPRNAAEEAEETYTYYDVGFSIDDITTYFNARYGLNYFCYDYNKPADYAKIQDKVTAIYEANKYKYMKLVEIMGYKYNPLYNVDGVELYGNAESLGKSTTTRTPSGTIKTVSGTEENNTITDTTSTHYINPYNETTTATRIDSQNKQSPITTKQTFEDNYSETNTLEHNAADNYKYNSTTGEWEKNGYFTVAAKDNAFGVDFGGAERYYAEKRIRQGNIGVTKSQELVSAQRDVVRYNILEEFFRDLEHDLVVGIY